MEKVGKHHVGSFHDLRSVKCRSCGKAFIPSPQWAYIWNRYYFCSWSCLREAERKRDAARVYKSKRESAEEGLEAYDDSA